MRCLCQHYLNDDMIMIPLNFPNSTCCESRAIDEFILCGPCGGAPFIVPSQNWMVSPTIKEEWIIKHQLINEKFVSLFHLTFDELVILFLLNPNINSLDSILETPKPPFSNEIILTIFLASILEEFEPLIIKLFKIFKIVGVPNILNILNILNV